MADRASVYAATTHVISMFVTNAGGLVQKYQQAVAAGKLLPDEEQAACVSRLSILADQLVGYSSSLAAHRQKLQEYQVASGSSCLVHMCHLCGALVTIWPAYQIHSHHSLQTGQAEAKAAGAEDEG